MKITKPIFCIFVYLLSLPALYSCSVAELRKEPPSVIGDESSPATIGGNWTEGGALSDPSRNPASTTSSISGHLNSEKTSDKASSTQNLYSNEVKYLKNSQITLGESPVKRATREDFRDNTPSDGSLWTSDGQTNYFLTKNNIFSIGDILTLKTDDQFSKDVVAEIKKTLEPKEKDAEITEAKVIQLAAFKKENATREIAQEKKDSKGLLESDEDEEEMKKFTVDWNKVDITPKVLFKGGDPVMVEITNRYPNGHYRIKGYKKVPYKNAIKIITVEGVVKAADISEAQELASNKLYEYRLETLK
jgi:flagellar basal body L-ring protein FlgH